MVLISADTQESSNYTKSSATKLRRIRGPSPKSNEKTWEVVVASAGDSMVADEAIDEIFYFLGEKMPSEDDPSVGIAVFRKEIGDIAFKTYEKFRSREVEGSEFSLLIAAAGEFPLILLVTCQGKTKELERTGLIGSGKVTGGDLLLSEFLKKDDLKEAEAMCLASLVISTVGHVDMFVSGKPDMFVCCQKEVFEFKDQYYREMLRKSESSWSLIKKIWLKMSEDEKFEVELKKLLKK
jgi:hypothetical protein